MVGLTLPLLSAAVRVFIGTAMFLVLAGVFGNRTVAQTPAPNENLPMQIQADSGIEWQQNAQLYIARGNAVASRGNSEVHADTLIAHYREVKGAPTASANPPDNSGGNPGGNTEIYRVEAEGHVTMLRDGQTVVGD